MFRRGGGLRSAGFQQGAGSKLRRDGSGCTGWVQRRVHGESESAAVLLAVPGGGIPHPDLGNASEVILAVLPPKRVITRYSPKQPNPER